MNSLAFMDLDMVDPNSLDPTDTAAIADAVNASPKQVRTVAINNAPNIFEVSIDDPVLISRAEDLYGNQALYTVLGNALADRFADRPEPAEVEQQIYAGFYSNEDKELLNQFQYASWADRVEIVQEFEDRRLRWLASRLVYLNETNLLSQAAQDHWKEAVNQRWWSDDPNDEWTTINKASEQLTEIENQEVLSCDDLKELKHYYSDLAAHGL